MTHIDKLNFITIVNLELYETSAGFDYHSIYNYHIEEGCIPKGFKCDRCGKLGICSILFWRNSQYEKKVFFLCKDHSFKLEIKEHDQKFSFFKKLDSLRIIKKEYEVKHVQHLEDEKVDVKDMNNIGDRRQESDIYHFHPKDLTKECECSFCGATHTNILVKYIRRDSVWKNDAFYEKYLVEKLFFICRVCLIDYKKVFLSQDKFI